ncbi:hypothetical protein RBH26_15735 [Natronolimnohabitans sp. A-GB9]|uniref:hypothetical protein n=1 Tax=Natronolimnohabitans sp. A-GB9 TaxID=3069757 RepID=UPI0027B72411|nr:hypothetical protein [Natronolimnohabitans sp. A-GB9]MDQ2051929.1 hypothetical protein [Natronolimnohabitans sp. A-GB9]
MLDRLDWTERLSLALTAVFAGTFAVTLQSDSPWVWLVWGTAMVLLAGSALVLVNRNGPSAD